MGPTRRYTEKPVIAAISGYAVAGGLNLRSGVTYALWNLMPYSVFVVVEAFHSSMEGLWIASAYRHGACLNLILTGRPIGAEEALSMGLVNRVVPSVMPPDIVRHG